jgi:hypothetical protein
VSPRKQKPNVKQKAAAAVVHTSAKPRGNPRALAIAHLALVLEDPKASQARKDKAARLLLSHAAAPSTGRRQEPAAAEKGKKELQREGAQSAGVGTSKWAGLLQ